MTPTNPPKEPLDQRLVAMVSKTHRIQLDAAMRLPGFRSEAQVVRYALDQILPQLLNDAAPKRSYAGRTRILVDTARALPAPDEDPYDQREKRVGTPRQPSRLRGPVTPAPEPLSETEAPAAPTYVEIFDNAVASLGFDPERIATVGSRPGGEVCLECFCVAPHHASTCSLASDSASA